MRTNDFTKECKEIAECINSRVAQMVPIKADKEMTLYYIHDAGSSKEMWDAIQTPEERDEVATLIIDELIYKHKWSPLAFYISISKAESTSPTDECIRIMFYYDINKLGDLYKAQPIKPERLTSYTIAGVLNDLADAYYTHPEERITLGSWADWLAECAAEYGITREDLKEFGYERALELYCSRLVYLGEIADWDWNANYDIVYLKQEEE